MKQKALHILRTYRVSLILAAAFCILLAFSVSVFGCSKKEPERRSYRSTSGTTANTEIKKEVEANPSVKMHRGTWEPLYENSGGLWLYMYKLDGKEYIMNNQGFMIEHVKAK